MGEAGRHTPAPWVVETHHRQGHDRMVPVWYVKGANDVGVAVQPAFSSPEHEEGNARLIAAAPALLDAAEPFAEYGKILAGQRVARESVVVELFGCRLTVADFLKLAEVVGKAGVV